MIIYMECTLQLMLKMGTPRVAVDEIIMSGAQKCVVPGNNYVLIEDKKESE